MASVRVEASRPSNQFGIMFHCYCDTITKKPVRDGRRFHLVFRMPNGRETPIAEVREGALRSPQKEWVLVRTEACGE